MLTDIPLFHSLSTEERAAIEAAGRRHRVSAGHVFLKMGDDNAALFVVVDGSVRVERPGVQNDTELAKLGRGAVFGELSFLDGGRANAKVVAVGPTEVLELRHEAFDRLMGDHPALAAKLWRNLAIELKRRLIRTNELVDHYVDLAQVLRDNPGYADLLGSI